MFDQVRLVMDKYLISYMLNKFLQVGLFGQISNKFFFILIYSSSPKNKRFLICGLVDWSEKPDLNWAELQIKRSKRSYAQHSIQHYNTNTVQATL